MLTCETLQRRTPDLSCRIPANWDQSFLSDADDGVKGRTPILRYQNVTGSQPPCSIITRCAKMTLGPKNEDRNNTDKTPYVNVPSQLVQQACTGALRPSIRTDLSPMSPRATGTQSTTGNSTGIPAAGMALHRLNESGFFHGRISPGEARQVLRDCSPGTFLVRSSSDCRYICSLTVRTSARRETTSVRIVLLDSGEFRLDADQPASHLLPRSGCVLDLIRRHMQDHRRPDRHPDSVILSRQGSGREIPLLLRSPVYRDRSPPSLKHLCRRRVNSLLDGRGVDRLYLTPTLKDYLNDYPSDI